jgi:Fe-S-cluster containining protein
MVECKACGKCCEVILLPKNMQEIKRTARGETKDSDCNFVARNFKEISRKKALKINSYLKNWKEDNGIKHYYLCRYYDKLTKKCIVYTVRPRTCYGFPWYEYKKLQEQSLYSKDCAFHEDLKK